MLYYKFMSYKRFVESILPGGAFIKVSRPCEFNDPFDCTGGLIGEFNSKVAEEYCNMFYVDALPNFYAASAKAHFLGQLRTRQFFNEWFRILSLSDASRLLPNEEFLMWAHYADNARGVRLTLDFSDYSKTVEPVEYVDTAPALNCSSITVMDPMKDVNLRSFLDACLVTKCNCWRYECESRVIFPINYKDLRPMSVCDAVKPIAERNFVFAMPKRMLREVAFGPGCLNLAEAQKYVELLRDNGYANIKSSCAREGGWYGY